ncbi:hypothetical protein L6250_02745 [Candidatus Parcubacteria bacterium]|nr:hypothetical protein [Patescibacteria group bacterium]MBU4466942.1 hypothetical protein [Patescibacteria group bacterium]MCG2688526.1 hypothetical protein [Candidatus Parcubacteria bacterium]
MSKKVVILTIDPGREEVVIINKYGPPQPYQTPPPEKPRTSSEQAEYLQQREIERRNEHGSGHGSPHN